MPPPAPVMIVTLSASRMERPRGGWPVLAPAASASLRPRIVPASRGRERLPTVSGDSPWPPGIGCRGQHRLDDPRGGRPRRRRSLGVSGSSIAARVATRRSRPASSSARDRGRSRRLARSAGPPRRGALDEAIRGHRGDEPGHRRWRHALDASERADRPRAAEDEHRQRRQAWRRDAGRAVLLGEPTEQVQAQQNGVAPAIQHRSRVQASTMHRILVAATNDCRVPISNGSHRELDRSDACRSHRRGQRRRCRTRRDAARTGPDARHRPRRRTVSRRSCCRATGSHGR